MEKTNFENSNKELSSARSYNLKEDVSARFKNKEGQNGLFTYQESNSKADKSSIENALSDGDAFSLSEPVDDYSLHYIYAMGIQYCARLKNRNEANSRAKSVEGRSMNGDQQKMTNPNLTSPNEVEGVEGEDGMDKSIVNRRRGGNLSRSSRGRQFPRRRGRPGGRASCKGVTVQAHHDVESEKFSLPSHNEEEQKGVSNGEYRTKIGRKRKSGGASNSRTEKSRGRKKQLSWSAQECPTNDNEGNDEGTREKEQGSYENCGSSEHSQASEYEFGIHDIDQKNICINQIMQQNPSSGVSHGGSNPNAPIEHKKKADEGSSTGNYQRFTNSGTWVETDEDLQSFKHDQDESDWINDLLLPDEACCNIELSTK